MTQLSLKIVVTGGSGFVGTELAKQLSENGYDVLLLTRQDVLLAPSQLAEVIEGCHGVINLAGVPVVHRWSKDYKQLMMESRIDLTRNLVASFRLMAKPPSVFISTSATGIYADEGVHTEEKYTYGTGFLARLAKGWEEEAVKASQYGVRTLIFRFGVVLGPTGGPVAEMLLPFKLGLGGKIGTGTQSFSWIHIDDLLKAYLFMLADENCLGVYNLVAPNSSTNSGMTKALGQALSRPTVFTVPSFVLHLRFGEGAEILTKGQHALPERLLAAGFSFKFKEIGQAMCACVS